MLDANAAVAKLYPDIPVPDVYRLRDVGNYARETFGEYLRNNILGKDIKVVVVLEDIPPSGSNFVFSVSC